MKATIYTTPKAAILAKLKEIGMAQQEDRKGPDAEMSRVAKREEKFDGTDTEYFKTIYNEKGLANREKHGSVIKPSTEQKAIETK